jgi:hypothetical protein
MSKFPSVESDDLGFEPLKAAYGAFVAHANFPFGSCAYKRLRPTFASPSSNSGDFHRLTHLFHSPTFKNRKPWHTPGDVKLLPPPLQSRRISHLEWSECSGDGIVSEWRDLSAFDRQLASDASYAKAGGFDRLC